jgi:uncharacterized protein (DUF433 family)
MVLDWSQCPAVERIPGRVSGAWLFRGTRMPVSTVFDNLEAGASIDDVAEWFDIPPMSLTAEKVKNSGDLLRSGNDLSNLSH